MYRFKLRLLSLMLIPGILLCGCSRKEEDTGAGYLFTCTIPSNPECLDPQYTSGSTADSVIISIMEGLLRTDENGELVCAGAESYTVTQDGMVYIFKLRRDSYWYTGTSASDLPVTADDYVFAFRRLVNPATRSPHSGDFACIENAVAVTAGFAEPEELGVSAPDEYTVVFSLANTDDNFLQMLAHPCAVPCNEEFFYSTNGRYGLDTDTVLCNGPFYLTQWVYDPYGGGNFLTMKKNRFYHDAEEIFPSSLQYHIMRTQEAADTDFSDSLSDVILTDTPAQKLGSSNSAAIKSTTYGLIFNPENELLQNATLRSALACGINRSATAKKLNSDLSPAYGLIPPGVTLLGRSYRELYADEQLISAYDPTQARRLFEQVADQEGAGMINTLQILIPTSLDVTDAMLDICQRWQDLFGYYIGIETVTPDEYERRIAAGEYSIALFGVRPSHNSCSASLEAFRSNAGLLGFDGAETGRMLRNAVREPQLSASVELYGEVEQSIIDTGAFIPLFYKDSFLVWTDGNTDLSFDPFTRCIDFRRAKHFS